MNNFAQDITFKSLLNDLENHFDGSQNLRMKALAYDNDLLNYLLANDVLKNTFFKVITANNFVFLKDEFLKFINLRLLSNSYTACANYIGLSFEKKQEKFIKTDGDVVLNFPFKDGVIKGGQTKDEQKLNEVFLNNILAKDEIDVLFTPKVISHFELISQQNSNQNSNQNSDYENLLQVLQTENPNLLIKGNNLIALHTLKYYLQQRKEKVKLIYIDPPYNTGNDSFNYNDKFNHSTWLCFMKNRLEIAKQLLSDDGVIFIQCDDNEQAYLKVLCDEIFGRENFVNVLTIKTKIGGVSGSSEGKSLKDATEFINIFAKNKLNLMFNDYGIKKPLFDYITSYTNDGKSWKYTTIITKLDGKKEIKRVGEITYFSYENFETQSVKTFAKENRLTEKEVYSKYSNKIFRTTNAQSSIRQKVINETSNILNTIISIEYKPIKGKNKDTTIEILYKDSNRNMLMFLSDNLIYENGEYYYLEGLNNLWTDIQYNNLSKEGEVDFTNAKKPEALLQRIIEISTNENDLVLDFFAGSGTTLAVAHKMKRRYIGIEQMDYIQTITKQRLAKVIDGEQGGISKSINWNGGGNFVYIELAELNAKFKQKINAVNDYNEFMLLAKNLDSKAFLNYKLDNKNITEIISSDELKNLNLDKQKQMLIACLDANMDYIPLQEIDDENYKFDAQVKQLNNAFYKINN